MAADGRFLRPNRNPKRNPSNHIRPIDVCLYDAATGKEVQRLPGDNDYDVYPEFSPEGRTVAYTRLETDETQREEVVLWDLLSGRERAVMHGSSDTRNSGLPWGVRNPFFSPDETMLLTDHLLRKGPRLWDVATGRLLLDLPAEDDWLFFSPDGRWSAGAPSVSITGSLGPTDIRVFCRTDKPLSPVIRGEAVKLSSSPPPRLEPSMSEARRALDAIRQVAEKCEREVLSKFGDVIKPGPERYRMEREWTAAHLRFGTGFLKVARDFPTDPAALEVLEHGLRSTGGYAEGEMGKLRDEALALILRDHQRSPDISNLVFYMSRPSTDSAEKALAALAENSPYRTIRGRAAWRMAEALIEKAEISRLVRVLPELLDDPEMASRKNQMKRLRLLDPDVVAGSAEEWYLKIRDRYADVPANDVQKNTLGESAESGLFSLRNLAIAKAAPDIEGEDLDGKRFHLF